MDVNDVVQPSVLIKKLLEKKIAPIMKEYDLRIVELDILFFLSKDEHLDTAKEIMELLEDINRSGTTIVMATHAKDIVDSMKKRVIAIEKGSIVRDDRKGMYENEN